MPGNILLPFVETIAGDTEFTGNLSGWALAGVQELDRLSFKLGREPSSLPHVAPPRELIVPPFEVSVKPGLAQPVPVFFLCPRFLPQASAETERLVPFSWLLDGRKVANNDLGNFLKIVVGCQDREPVLHSTGGNPDIVGGNWVPAFFNAAQIIA